MVVCVVINTVVFTFLKRQRFVNIFFIFLLFVFLRSSLFKVSKNNHYFNFFLIQGNIHLYTRNPIGISSNNKNKPYKWLYPLFEIEPSGVTNFL